MNSRAQAPLMCRVLSLSVGLALAAAPLPALAGPAAEKASGTVALMRFSGPEPAADLRDTTRTEFEQAGFSIKAPALDIQTAAKKVKCKKGEVDQGCLETIGKWLNKNSKTAADFIVYGTVVAEGQIKRTTIVVYDIKKGETVKRFDTAITSDDYIVPLILPKAAATATVHSIKPPDPPTEAEQKILAELDEPAKTPEEIAAEKRAIEEAEAAAAEQTKDAIDTESIPVDLKKDFKDFCRNEKRTKRKSRDDPRDLRPACKRGPFWGYWQPRAWVALGLTSGAVVATGIFYGLALAARGPYKDAVDNLDAFEGSVNGDPATDPNVTCSDGQCYDHLATEVSKTGATMRRRAIIGDALLGTSALLGGVLGIIIYQDRRDAKNFIKQEKGLRAISNVRVTPIVGRGVGGAGLGFQF